MERPSLKDDSDGSTWNKVLGTKHYNDVYMYTECIQVDWKRLATYLGISPETIKIADADKSTSSDKLMEMINAWLRIENPDQPEPTWRKLYEAVKKIDNKQAKKIAQQQHRIESPVSMNALIKELHNVQWSPLGLQLGVPESTIQSIQQQYTKPQHCLKKMLRWWMDNDKDVTWVRIALALRDIHCYELSEWIFRKYCLAKIECDGPENAVDLNKVIEVDKKVVDDLMELKLAFSYLVAIDLRNLIHEYLHRNLFRTQRKRKVQEFIRMVETFLDKPSHTYHSFDEVYDALKAQNDIFQVSVFQKFVSHYFCKLPSCKRDGLKFLDAYELKLKEFLHSVTLEQLKNAFKEADIPDQVTYTAESKCECLTLILSQQWAEVSLSEVLKKLMHNIFGVHKSVFINIVVRDGSIVVQWRFREELKPVIIEIAKENIDCVKGKGILQLAIGDETIYAENEDAHQAVDDVHQERTLKAEDSLSVEQSSGIRQLQYAPPIAAELVGSEDCLNNEKGVTCPISASSIWHPTYPIIPLHEHIQFVQPDLFIDTHISHKNAVHDDDYFVSAYVTSVESKEILVSYQSMPGERISMVHTLHNQQKAKPKEEIRSLEAVLLTRKLATEKLNKHFQEIHNTDFYMPRIISCY